MGIDQRQCEHGLLQIRELQPPGRVYFGFGKKTRCNGYLEVGVYKKRYSYTYCRHAYGSCEPGCPENVPVNTIMRYNHYFVAQGREKEAMLKYAALATPKADRCKQCPGHYETAYLYGVPIQGLLELADNRLTLP